MPVVAKQDDINKKMTVRQPENLIVQNYKMPYQEMKIIAAAAIKITKYEVNTTKY